LKPAAAAAQPSEPAAGAAEPAAAKSTGTAAAPTACAAEARLTRGVAESVLAAESIEAFRSAFAAAASAEKERFVELTLAASGRNRFGRRVGRETGRQLQLRSEGLDGLFGRRAGRLRSGRALDHVELLESATAPACAGRRAGRATPSNPGALSGSGLRACGGSVRLSSGRGGRR